MADSAGPASRVSTGNETEVLLARAERRHGKDAPVTEQLTETEKETEGSVLADVQKALNRKCFNPLLKKGNAAESSH